MEKPDPTLSVCTYRWNYPIINFDRLEFRHCCKTPAHKVDFSELRKKGEAYFSKNDLIIKRRQEMLDGIRHPECSACWQLEDKGIASFRNHAKKFSDYIDPGGQRLGESEADHLRRLRKEKDLTSSIAPYTLEIVLDNTCNMKCIYCNEQFSSLWEQENIRFGLGKKQTATPENLQQIHELKDIFWNWLEQGAIHEIDTISLIGGEPFLNKDFYPLIHRLLTLAKDKKVKKYQIDLAIITNLNLNQRQLDSFKQILPELTEFFNVKLYLSMDSVGQRAEYIRFGLDWQRWNENLDQLLSLKAENFHISFLIAVSALSVPTLQGFFEYLYQKYKHFNVPIYIKKIVVTEPAVHSFLCLPPSFSKSLDDASRFLETVEDEMDLATAVNGSWKNFRIGLSEMSRALASQQRNDMQMIEFFNWFSANDRKRGHSLVEAFPELADFWSECSTKSPGANP